MKHLPEFPHVCSIPFCLSARLPSSLSLSLFLLSLFLPSSSLSQPSLLPHSFLSPAPPSFSLPFVSFLSREPHLLQLPWSCAFYSHSHRSPQSEPIYLLRLPLRIREFSSPRPSAILPLSPSPFARTHTCWIDKSSATHTHARTHRRTELWSGFVYDRERQYRDCFRVVSSREMYRCQEYVLYVWVLG